MIFSWLYISYEVTFAVHIQISSIVIFRSGWKHNLQDENAQSTFLLKWLLTRGTGSFNLSIFPFTDRVIVNQMIFSQSYLFTIQAIFLSKVLGQFCCSLRPPSRNSDNVRPRHYYSIGCDFHLQSNCLYSVAFFHILC